ncbi:hypothetical protein GWO43_27840 [candidate division KSB1 bacterium]|nr:hypothetical protein [candidate division KSB1 bacterium]NIR70691.1 hypothetical protein [candidate division KSB1 bacterium]NIS27755.1 hypothetical protein [candidate division KSB1 bacterium]NIT74602.1 hypothetical protein [candidate division KSB1 bacterium]NIU28422.1 hypothetical protein [candidate division KSB1 bacterium]
MKAIELFADVDKNHRLEAEIPKEIPPGKVKLILLFPEEDEAGAKWMEGISREWATELEDPREDIYTLENGEPVNEAE